MNNNHALKLTKIILQISFLDLSNFLRSYCLKHDTSVSTEHEIWGHLLSLLLKRMLHLVGQQTSYRDPERVLQKSLLPKVLADYCLEKEFVKK